MRSLPKDLMRGLPSSPHMRRLIKISVTWMRHRSLRTRTKPRRTSTRIVMVWRVRVMGIVLHRWGNATMHLTIRERSRTRRRQLSIIGSGLLILRSTKLLMLWILIPTHRRTIDTSTRRRRKARLLLLEMTRRSRRPPIPSRRRRLRRRRLGKIHFNFRFKKEILQCVRTQ